MYLTHFGLQRRPFPSTPDTTCYYPATSHEQALAHLQRSLADGEALVLLVGEAGTGKTLLCHCLLERFQAEAAIAFLTNSHIGTRKDLLQAVLYDLALPYEGGTEQELRLRLTDFLLKNFSEGRKTLLVVDEGHFLSVDALEELRLLCNLEAGGGKAVQVVLVAQPAIQRILRRPELASFRQRLAVRTRVDALGVDEAVDYLVHHLRTAGGKAEEIVTDEALEMLARGTRGVPRLLNQAGHQTLALACELEAEVVDAEVVLEVLNSLGLEQPDNSEEVPFESPGKGPRLDEINAAGNSRQAPLSRSSSKAHVSPGLAAEESNAIENAEDVLSYRLYDPPRQPA